jgi:hypothetical protein
MYYKYLLLLIVEMTTIYHTFLTLFPFKRILMFSTYTPKTCLLTLNLFACVGSLVSQSPKANFSINLYVDQLCVCVLFLFLAVSMPAYNWRPHTHKKEHLRAGHCFLCDEIHS